MFAMMKESQKLPIHVKAWMGFMVLTFAAHFPYIDSPLHLVSLATFLVTLGIFAPLSFALTRNINALAASHFVAWPIVLAFGVRDVLQNGLPPTPPLGDAVLITGFGVFLVSLILDYRILMSELRRPGASNAADASFIDAQNA